MMKLSCHLRCVVTALAFLSLCGACRSGQGETPDPENGGASGDEIVSDTALPPLTGKLVFHNYTSYDAEDAVLYLYDFAENRLTALSRDWTVVRHPMNGHFSPDGKRLVFMGIGAATGSWDIFLYDLEKGGEPVNLTPDGRYRDEDPKFSFDGTSIAFKRNDRLARIAVATGALEILSENDGGKDPYSMPYYSTDGSRLVFGGGAGSSAYIGCWDLRSASVSILVDRPGITDYYPITLDEEAFYFSSHYSATNPCDQLYKGFWSGAEPVRLAFNRSDADYSDAFPVGKGWLFLVSTRRGGKGGYDLYIAHETSGAIYSLDQYNLSLNTSKNELGPAYCAVR